MFQTSGCVSLVANTEKGKGYYGCITFLITLEQFLLFLGRFSNSMNLFTATMS